MRVGICIGDFLSDLSCEVEHALPVIGEGALKDRGAAARGPGTAGALTGG